MQTILVATDLSDRSRPAVNRAVNLAVAAKARLVVLNIVNDSIPDDLSRQVQVGAKTILSEQVAKDAAGQDLDYTVQVIVGDPIAEVGAAALDTKADLLVVGQHRRRKFLDQIRETTVEHFIRSSQIPVLLVTQNADQPYKNVLFGTALSPVCTAALKTIPKVAPNANVVLFHAHEVSFANEARGEFETWKAMYPMPKDLPDPIYIEARASDALEGLMRDGNYDLLAIGGHTRAPGGRYFLGKFTADLIRKPPCDLLIAK